MYQDTQILNLNIDDILPNRFQPRIKFNEQAINELAESIKVHGVIQPIVVRKISDKYEIIAGERRYKASVLAGKQTIPAIVVSLDDKNSAEIALIENVQRQNLTPIEEAVSYKKILDMGYISQVALGEKLGKTQSTIANKLRLLNLNEEVQEALMDGKISERHARSLLRLNEKSQVVMLNRIINERLTVRKTDEEIEKILKNEKPIIEEIEEEGEQEMNNEMYENLNIPTEPIIEETDETLNQMSDSMLNQAKEEIENLELSETNNKIETVSSPVSESIISDESLVGDNVAKPIIENNQEINEQPSDISLNSDSDDSKQVINPGFMDVEKIENEAEEIYKEPDPIADMDMLLDTSNNPVVEQPVSDMQAPLPEDDEAPAPTGGRFFTMFNMNQNDDNPNFVNDIESKEVNMDFGVPTPDTSSNFDFNVFNNTVDTSSIINESMESIDNETSDLKPLVEPVEEIQPEPVSPADIEDIPLSNPTPIAEPEESEEIDFNKTPETYSLNDDESFTQSSEQIQEVEEAPILQRPFSQIEDPSKITYDDMGEIEVKLPQAGPAPTAADFRTVINTIRECASTIEKFGFTIDTEEIDFEDSYQVTFKIDKK